MSGKGVQVGFHEPGEGLEVDERDGVGGGGVGDEGLHATALLAVAGEGAGGVEWGWFKRVKGRVRLLREDDFERVIRGKCEATGSASCVFDLVGTG